MPTTNPNVSARFGDPRVPKKFWDKVYPIETGCWIWTGAHSSKTGYGNLRYRATTLLSHRFFYLELVGPITNYTLDHLCRTRSCVNPEHLESVSTRENVLRGVGNTATNHRKTLCIRGHELAGDNLVPYALTSSRGNRECLACKRERRKLSYERTGK